MQHPLTKQQLHHCVAALRKSLVLFDRRCGENLLFLNKQCLYTHARAFGNIGELLDQLEPYIPLTLSEENFDLFLDAVQVMNENGEPPPDLFSDKAKIDFVASLRKVQNRRQWEQLINVCDAIRDIKEQLAYF